jgi:hypothetical protein
MELEIGGVGNDEGLGPGLSNSSSSSTGVRDTGASLVAAVRYEWRSILDSDPIATPTPTLTLDCQSLDVYRLCSLAEYLTVPSDPSSPDKAYPSFDVLSFS